MQPEVFRKGLVTWYGVAGRDLPWVGESNPYRIWICETILQQTRVEQGLPYFHRFLNTFPDLASLAAATEDQLFKVWEGLGYYRRARHLQAAARFITYTLGGQFPRDYIGIRQLKGVGPYTAAAIASFAFSLPHAVVDGNVRRVLARLFAIQLPLESAAGRLLAEEKAAMLLDRKLPGRHNQAMMDFGATVCLPRKPRCGDCVFSADCRAFREGQVDQYPRKAIRAPLRDRYFHLLLIREGSNLLLIRRMAQDIWQGLYFLPYLETEGPAWAGFSTGIALGGLELPAGVIRPLWLQARQVLSHQRIHAYFYEVSLEVDLLLGSDYFPVPIAAIKDYAFPRFLKRFLEDYNSVNT